MHLSSEPGFAYQENTQAYHITRATTDTGKNIATTESSRNILDKALYNNPNIITNRLCPASPHWWDYLATYWLFVANIATMINYKG